MGKIKKLDYEHFNYVFKHGEKRLSGDITTNSGIYLLYDKELELIYIGMASNFRQRLLEHTRYDDSTKTKIPEGEIKYYYFIECKDLQTRYLYESILIITLKPKYNISKKR